MVFFYLYDSGLSSSAKSWVGFPRQFYYVYHANMGVIVPATIFTPVFYHLDITTFLTA